MADAKNVLVYSTPTCPYCTQVKDYLKQKGIEYIDYNVGADLQAREAMKAKTQQMGVPVIDVDGTIVIGFDRNKLDDLLK